MATLFKETVVKPVVEKYNAGFMVKYNRRAKADKIIKLLNEGMEKVTPVAHVRQLLDIGTGNGEIAGHLSEYYNVISVDVTDQREVSDGFTFIELEGERLPFSDRSFDVVVSNHVIEHVRDANMHLSEIWRVLKDDGLVYLATPNRFWPWEAHNMIPLLHYFRNRLVHPSLRLPAAGVCQQPALRKTF